MAIGAADIFEFERKTRSERVPLSLQDQVAELYEAARQDIYRYIVIMGVRHEQAQEICQEAFLRLYTALSDGQQIENRRAWVFTVARNQALTMRSSAGGVVSLEPAIEERLAAESPSPEQNVLDRERFRRLHRAVGSLSEQQRQCLHLRTEGFRYREIAGVIGVSTSTVGEIVQRAVSRLRKALYE